MNSYNSVADLCTLGVLYILFFAIKSSYYSKSEKNLWMKRGITYLSLATVVNILYMSLSNYTFAYSIYVVFILRCITDSLLLLCLYIFSSYLIAMFEKNDEIKKTFKIINKSILLVFVLLVLFSQHTHFGLYINNGLLNYSSFFLDPFAIGYGLYIVILFIQLIIYKKNILTKASNAIALTFVIAIVIVIYEVINEDTTFLSYTYLLPLIMVFALFHSNSYDIATGTLDNNSLNELIIDAKKNHSDYLMVSLNFVGNKNVEDFLMVISKELHHFYDNYFIKPYTFRISDRRFILVCKRFKKISGKDTLEEFKHDFYELYKVYEMKYKLVCINSSPFLNNLDEYLDYIIYLEENTKVNTIKEFPDKELAKYFEYERIQRELREIAFKQDLDDERVLVYVQPIYDLNLKKFKSAESLMRLKINDEIIYPDVFIPIAEKNKLIHSLSLIMLNKVCKSMKNLINEYDIDRISVNFSTIDLTSSTIVDDIKKIFKLNDIPYDNIGIELTESESIDNYEELVLKVNELSKLGIKLYLDDFGTGYSNFERIMNLPFDIIKFDKSLLENSNKDKKFKLMTKSLAKTYSELGYSILFEGVESEKNSKLCSNEFYASYLQGYHYSKPIPIERLTEFLEKK